MKNSVEPERFLVEPPRSSYSEDSRQAGKSSVLQNLTSLSLSLLYKELTWEYYRKQNHIFFTLLPRGVGGIYWGFKSVLWVKVALGGGTCQADWPSRVAGQPSSVAHRLSHIGSSSYRLNMTRVESIISLAPNPGRPAPPWVGWARAFCHIISPCHII
jgi:hypothetical protein